MSINHRDSERNPVRPKVSRANRSFEAAVAADNGWFRANPDKTSRRRKVKPKELPRRLRDHGILEVVIERVGPSQFVRRFLDLDGRPVFSGLDYYDEPVVPGAPEQAVQFLSDGNGKLVTPFSVAPKITDRDRDNSGEHPGEHSYTRPATAAEFECVEIPPGSTWIDGTVTVTQIAPGYRLRSFSGAYAAPHGGVHARAK